MVARRTSKASAASSLMSSPMPLTFSSAHNAFGNTSAGATDGFRVNPVSPKLRANKEVHFRTPPRADPHPPAPTLLSLRNNQGTGGRRVFSLNGLLTSSCVLVEASPFSSRSSSSSASSASRASRPRLDSFSRRSATKESWSLGAAFIKTTVTKVRFFTVCVTNPSTSSTANCPVLCSSTATQPRATVSTWIGRRLIASSSRAIVSAAKAPPFSARYRPTTRAAASCTHWCLCVRSCWAARQGASGWSKGSPSKASSSSRSKAERLELSPRSSATYALSILVTAVSEPGHELAIFSTNSNAWYTVCQPHTVSSSSPGGAFVEVPICGSC
mmetsp:Transcript_9216/g.30679  ORF Transcript_9216/g.30679 Transcript_9216/m.30679 type:complete len:329 (-) Transcript_9216:268-1254(-)